MPWTAVTTPLAMTSRAIVATTAKPRRVDHDAMSPAMPVSDEGEQHGEAERDADLAGLLADVELTEQGHGVEDDERQQQEDQGRGRAGTPSATRRRRSTDSGRAR